MSETRKKVVTVLIDLIFLATIVLAIMLLEGFGWVGIVVAIAITLLWNYTTSYLSKIDLIDEFVDLVFGAFIVGVLMIAVVLWFSAPLLWKVIALAGLAVVLSFNIYAIYEIWTFEKAVTTTADKTSRFKFFRKL